MEVKERGKMLPDLGVSATMWFGSLAAMSLRTRGRRRSP
jgi:hypothetical protein